MINFSALNTQTLIPSASPSTGGDNASAEESAKKQAEKEKIDFLNLLLTQLTNQNPLDPMDTDEWTAQLTRYSILEQGIETNEKLSVTNDLLQSSAVAASFSYIGKLVEVETNMSAVQDGQATWSYLVDGNASDVKLTVSDKNGKRIDEIDGGIANGVKTFNFDAASYGLADGDTLYLSVNATDNDGNKLDSQISSLMTVEGVWSDENQSYLTAGTLSFKASDVIKLVEKDTTATATATTNQP